MPHAGSIASVGCQSPTRLGTLRLLLLHHALRDESTTVWSIATLCGHCGACHGRLERKVREEGRPLVCLECSEIICTVRERARSGQCIGAPEETTEPACGIGAVPPSTCEGHSASCSSCCLMSPCTHKLLMDDRRLAAMRGQQTSRCPSFYHTFTASCLSSASTCRSLVLQLVARWRHNTCAQREHALREAANAWHCTYR